MSDVSVLFIADIDLLDISCCPRKSSYSWCSIYIESYFSMGIFLTLKIETHHDANLSSLVALQNVLIVQFCTQPSKNAIPHTMIYYYCTVNNRCYIVSCTNAIWSTTCELLTIWLTYLSLIIVLCVYNAAQKVLREGTIFYRVWSN